MIRKTLAAIFLLPLFAAPMTALANPNPFSVPSTLPLQAPPFNRIKDSDYLPAFQQGMQQQSKEIEQIANNPAPATFANTIEALEKSGAMLDRVSEVFFAIVQANTNPTLDKIQTHIAPQLAEHEDKIYLNPILFARVKKLYQDREQLHLDPEALQLLKIYYARFIHAGANLSGAEKVKLQKLNKRIATLETNFQQKLLAAAKKAEFVVKNKTDLIGLDSSELAALLVKKGKAKEYVIPLQNTTQQPLLESINKREIRQQLFKLSWNRAEQNDANDTRQTILELAQLRAEKAELLGYPNYAAYVLYDQMAEKPEAVQQFLAQLIPATGKKAAADAQEIQAMINKTHSFKLQAWDWNYYAEQIRKAKFDLDQNTIKPYFELDSVLKNGVFYAANQLYGITFKERHDLPVYHPDVRVFDVFDKDKLQLGLIYLDYFKRDNKTGGAWMSQFMQQSKLLGTKPVVYNVTNFTKPAQGQPALLTSDDVTAMFHEFGHALQGLFVNNQYPTTNSNIARDFVEFPSQFNEHWAFYPAVLQNYAKHYKTGAALPNALVDKIIKAHQFNQGYSIGEILAAAALDIQWHQLSADEKVTDVDQFEKQALQKTHTDFNAIPPRYRSSYFLHIWSNEYAAGYYAYLWTEMLDDDIYTWLMDHGGLTRENGQRLRDRLLSKGRSQNYKDMFVAFYGKEPSIEPMLKHRGLI